MTIFCTLYYILSYLEIVPQIVKLIKTKSSSDYSLGMVFVQFLATTSWTLYIFTSKQNMIVYIGTIADMVLLILVDYLLLKYYKNK